MNKRILLGIVMSAFSFMTNAQCDSLNFSSSYTVNSDILLSGTFVVNGTFTVPAGVTVYVTPYESNGCGQLKIYATNIVILGTINGDYAGYPGGTGGIKGNTVNSQTGTANALTDCTNSGSNGHVEVEAGHGGAIGQGPGGGNPGMTGGSGSGPKQYCGNVGDDAGLVGGAGGAGGGAGGSYGGQAANGAVGGAGNSTAVAVDLPISSAYTIVGGAGGQGGAAVTEYGTASGRDIELGSGGAGAGAGGRSYYVGTNGAAGGNGGGLVFLKAYNSLEISGTITVNGENGGNGGNGGTGDATADCCSDGCNGCDERTFSAGAGAGSGGGGGAGGGIFIESLGTADVSGTLSSVGGNGGAGGTKGTGASCDYDGGIFCGTQSITAGDGGQGGQGGAGSGGRIKIYVSECSEATLSGTIVVDGGTGNQTAAEGTYEEVCGYAGLSDVQLSLGWTFYPNPASEQLTVEIISGNLDNEYDLLVFDGLGKIVLQEQMQSTSTTLDIRDLPAGIYSVKISGNSTTEVKRFIKN